MSSGCPAKVIPDKACKSMLFAVDGPSKLESGQFEDGVTITVCLLEEDGCNFVGVSEVVDDFQFGDGEALYIKLED